MPSLSSLLAVAAIIGFFSAILLVIFGQITVRKLRKNPETKDHLGAQFLGGWDILNVAQALSLPKVIIRRFEQSPLYFLEANTELLYKHTTIFDRVLARVFYMLFMTFVFAILLLMMLDFFWGFG